MPISFVSAGRTIQVHIRSSSLILSSRVSETQLGGKRTKMHVVRRDRHGMLARVTAYLHRISVSYKPAVYRPSFLVLYAPRFGRVARLDFASFVLGDGRRRSSLFARNEDHLLLPSLLLFSPPFASSRLPRFPRRLLRRQTRFAYLRPRRLLVCVFREEDYNHASVLFPRARVFLVPSSEGRLNEINKKRRNRRE